MSFLIGAGKSKSVSKTPSMLKGYRAQTSVYGNVIPIVYGCNRISGNLLWFGDFTAIPHTSQASGGGKGFGSGSQQGNTTVTYTYTGAAVIGLCEGPIAALLNIYETKGYRRINDGSAIVTLSPGHNTYQASPVGSVFTADLGVSRAQAYSVPVVDYGNPSGSVTLTGVQQIPMVRVGGAPASGQYSVSVLGLYTFNAADAAAGITITASWRYSPSTLPAGFTQIAFLGWTVLVGTRPQSPWGYLTSKHPGQDLGYDGIALIADSQFNLGTQGTMQNFSFEILGFLSLTGGVLDANPASILNDLLPNLDYGANIPASMIGDWTQFSNYCLANGLLLSPVIDAQQSAAKWIQDILDACNSEVVWSQGKLKIIPYGDTSAVGNGAVFIPNTQPIFDLTDDDFLGTDDPLQVTIPTSNDIVNAVQVEWLNRANDYNPEITEEKDDGSIFTHGLRHASVKQLHGICNAKVAAQVANILLKRSVYIRKKFKFKTDFRYCGLEPMDIVTVTDTQLGYNKLPVRLTLCTESADGEIDFEAEEFPWGTAAPTLYPKQAPASFGPNTQSDPGNVNTPIIFEPPPRLWKNGATGLGAGGGGEAGEIWFGLSGANPNWGGCEIWWSLDNVNYKRLTVVNAPSRMGTLTANLSAGSDPDTTDTVSVDITESFGALNSGSQADADNLNTLCLLQAVSPSILEELISYTNANLTGANKYDLTTYLRRGVINTSSFGFSIGDNFLRLDSAVQGVTYDSKFIGATIYFKFLSFNTYGNMVQTLAQVSSVSYVPRGAWFFGQFVPGVNGLSNPGFELNAALTPLSTPIGWGQPLTDDWFYQVPGFGATPTPFWAVEIDTAHPRSGLQALLFTTIPGQVVPGGVGITPAVGVSKFFIVKPGDVMTGGIWVRTDLGTGPPPNLSISIFSRIGLYSKNKQFIGQLSVPPQLNFGNPQTGVFPYQQLVIPVAQVPALVGGQTPVYARLEIDASLFNFAGSNWTPTSTAYVKLFVDDCELIAVSMLGDSGVGGAQGIVPAPAAGDAAAGRVLTADGSWSVPAPSGVNNQTGAAYPVVLGDAGKLVTHSNAGAVAVTLPLFPARFFYYTKNRGPGNVTITPGGGATIDGAANLVLTTGQRAIIMSDGANYFTA